MPLPRAAALYELISYCIVDGVAVIRVQLYFMFLCIWSEDGHR